MEKEYERKGNKVLSVLPEKVEREASVYDRLPQSKKEEFSQAIKETLQFIVDTDLKIYGRITDDAAMAIQKQGYIYSNGKVEKKEPSQAVNPILKEEAVPEFTQDMLPEQKAMEKFTGKEIQPELVMEI